MSRFAPLAAAAHLAAASGMVAAHRRAPFALALFAGDNIYPCGADATVAGADACAFAADGNTLASGFTPPEDPLFGRHERPLARLAESSLPVWLSLGNHDVELPSRCGAGGDPARERLEACLQVARRSPLWRMPGRHYVLDEGPARFIVVDANLAIRDYGGFSFADEVAFVEAAAAGCDTRTCFLVGHQPPVTAGSHRDELGSAAVRARMDQLLAAGGGKIRAYLAGHDHDLQHLRTPAGLDVLVSGNGCDGRPEERFDAVSRPGARLLFGSVRWGYGVLEVGSSGWRYRFEADDGQLVYCCAADGGAPCEPVGCR